MLLVPPARGLIASLSSERLRHELDLILEEAQAVAMLGRLSELDLLQPVHPALAWNEGVPWRFTDALRPVPEDLLEGLPAAGRGFLNWHFWLMEVPRMGLESLESRLHFQANLLASLSAASELWRDLPSLAGLKPSQFVARLEDLPLSAPQAVFLAAPDGEPRQNIHRYLATWRHVKPKTDGYALQARGLPPGPRYRQILQRLREARLDGEVTTDEAEMKLLEVLTA